VLIDLWLYLAKHVSQCKTTMLHLGVSSVTLDEDPDGIPKRTESVYIASRMD